MLAYTTDTIASVAASKVAIGGALGVIDVGKSTNIKWHEGAVPLEDKERLLQQRGCVLWFTGW